MKLPRVGHRHVGPPVAIEQVKIRSSAYVSLFTPVTRVLRRCVGCRASFVTELAGHWTLEQIQEAEGRKESARAD